MSKTKIEWADMTVNPVVGCSKCSPGCDNCYAEKMAYRLSKMPQTAAKYAGVVDKNGWTGKTNFDVSSLAKLPKQPKRIFVGSMCDLFHESVSFETLSHIMGHLALTRSNAHHSFMLLTKRPERMREFFAQWKPYREVTNLWLGVTVCNQAEADAKIPVLLDTLAAGRFVSVEPMLGTVDLMSFIEQSKPVYRGDNTSGFIDYESLLHWIICGGETGLKARPMHPGWARRLRDQCVSAGVPFFFKGWGEWMPTSSVDIYNTPRGDGTFGREFPNSEGRSILADGRCCIVQLPEKPSRAFLARRGYRADAIPGESYEIDRQALNEAHAHEYGLDGLDYQWMHNVGKKRAGRLLDGREWNEVPS